MFLKMPREALLLLLSWAAVLISGSEAADSACAAKKIDLMLAIDHSKSIRPAGLRDMQTAIEDLVKDFDFGAIRLGCVRFAKHGEKVIHLGAIQSQEDYEKVKTKCTERTEGDKFNSGTNTGDGMKIALEELKKKSRTDATKVMLIMSDGKCTKEDKLVEAIAECEKHPDIFRMAVGVGPNAKQKELEDIASGSADSNTVNVRNFQELKKLSGLLRYQICTVKEQMESTIECGRICLKNGHVVGNSRKEMSKIEFHCNPGYLLNGAKEATCGSNGQWSANTPTCDKVKKCSFKLGLSKGKIDRAVNKRTNDHNMPGGKVKHSCSKNFKLDGQEELTCGQDGQWSDKTPSCKYNVCPPLSIGDGRIKSVDPQVNGKAIFECNKDFELVGQKELTCVGANPNAAEGSPESRHRWNADTPSCKRIGCFAALGSIKHGRGEVQGDGSVHFFCNDGYKLDGSAVITCDGDLPSAPVPQCKEVRCKYVTAVKYGELSYSSDLTTLTLTCKPGYKLKGGDSGVYTCVNKVWVGGIGSCVDNRCPIIKGQFSNGYIENNNIIPGSVATINCNAGYKLSDTNNKLTCGSNGQWDRAIPKCDRDNSQVDLVRKCPFINVKDGSVSTSERNENDQITCSCNTGFEVVGATTLTCNHKYRWEPAPCKCKAALCPAPKQLHGGKTVGEALHEGAKFTYSCFDGFTLEGASDITCTRVGKSLQWSPAEPTCKYVLCPSLYMLRFGHFVGSGNTEGSKRTLNCGNDYALEKGVSEITCQGNQWKPFIDSCERNTCRKVKMISNGRLVTKGASYKIGTSIEVKCNDRYIIKPEGTTKITCQADGSWTEATCVYNLCNPLPAIRNGKTRNYKETPSATVGFYCDPGYIRNGPKEIECLPDLTWSAHPPTCEERTRCSTLCPSNAIVNSISNYVGAVATFTCPAGKKLVGSSSVTCQANGQWTALPTCEKDAAASFTGFGVASVGQTPTQTQNGAGKPAIATKMNPDTIQTLDVCKNKKIVVEFCVDTSRSIDDRELEVVRTFVQCLAKSFDPESELGLVVFNGESNTDKKLGGSNDFYEDLLTRNFSATKGGTRTDLGIDNMLGELARAGASPPRAGVIITDGVATCSAEEMDAAVKKIKDFKVKDPTFDSYAVGVGTQTSPEELGKITTGTTVMRLPKLKDISNENIADLVTQICENQVEST